MPDLVMLMSQLAFSAASAGLVELKRPQGLAYDSFVKEQRY
jgi:hypothetical protein